VLSDVSESVFESCQSDTSIITAGKPPFQWFGMGEKQIA
jgi:hypothetical protein